MLGEYRTNGYRATLRNEGKQDITAAIVDQQSGKAVTSVELPAGDRQSLTIADGQEVHLINAGKRQATVKVKSPVKGSQGMRYIDRDETAEPNNRVIVPSPVPAAAPTPTATTEADDTAGETSAKVTLAPGQRLIVGEGSNKHYNLTISNRGSGLEVSGRNKENGNTMQSFGLGRFGKVEMAIRPNENLYIVNTSTKKSTVTLKMDKPVVGARVE